MKKQIFRLLLVLVLAASLVPMGAFAEEAGIIAGGDFGETLTWTLDTAGTLTVSGNGPMPDHAQPWMEYIGSVRKAVIEPGVTNIGYGAFSGASNLTEVSLPSGITSIDTHAFTDCTGLTNVTIPQGVTSIGYGAFWGASNLTEVSLPSGITSIDTYAFVDCTSLTNVTIPQGVTGIGFSAFSGCTALESVTIPGSVLTLGEYAFYDCTGLTAVTIQEGVGSIGGYAFNGCSSLKDVSIPEGIVSIGRLAFEGCALTSVTIPATVTEIGYYAFADCTNLRTVVFQGDAPAIDTNVFANVVANAYHTMGNATWTDAVRQNYGGTLRWKLMCAGEHSWQDATCTAPKTCTVCAITEGTALGHDEISYAAKPATCTEPGWNAYVTCRRCDYGTRVEIPALGHAEISHEGRTATCTEPGWDAYVTCSRCDYSTYEEIPAPGHDELHHKAQAVTCTEPGWNAYVTCRRCDYSTYAEIPAPGHAWTNSSCTEPMVCTVCGTVGGPADADSHTFVDGVCVCGLRGGTFGVGLTWVLDGDGNLTIFGTGAMPDFDYSGGATTAPWGKFGADIKAVVIRSGVTSVGQSAFAWCRSLKRITIPESVTRIGTSAFYFSSVSQAELPEGLLRIEDEAFYACVQLANITIPSTVSYIGEEAFSGCKKLTNAVIPDGITGINHSTFSGCDKLASVTIPKGITYIDSHAFYNCTSLTTVVIPEGTRHIGDGAFDGCTALTSVSIPESVAIIEYQAFMDCRNLKNIVIPSGVAEIQSYAFKDCFGLNRITFQGDAPGMDTGAFAGVVADTYYPYGNASWTEAKRQNYGGTLTWKTACPGDHTWDGGTVTTEPTYTAPGVRTFTCTACGETRTEDIAQLQSTCTFTQASVSLAGDIGLNYYAELSENIVSDPGAFMRFTFDNQVQDVPVHQAIRQKDGTYRFSCYLAAKDMACRVTAQMHTSRGTVGEAKTYSVRDYCTAIIKAYGNTASQAKLVNLLRSMLNYGTQSQASLGHNTMDLANSGLSAADRVLPNPTDLSAYAHSAVGTEEGIQVASASLILRTTTTIRVYFQLTGDKTIDQYSFTAGGKAVSPVHHSGKQYYVDLVGVEARNLDTMYQITCGGITVNYCGMSYVRSTLEYPGFTEDAKNMARALYGYAMAANEYFGN